MGIWDIVAGPLIAIVNKIIPDKTAAAAAVAQLQQLQIQGDLQTELAQLQAVTVNQSDIDKVEASNGSMFVAGWRPAVGWVCAAAVALIYIIGPFFVWMTSLLGHPTPFPALDTMQLMTLLFGMLGMGTLRTVDKANGVSTTKTTK